ncbi:acyl-CoA dehydrogenase [Mycobacterium sp. MBM]|nr:acyl-CoA dehydrogenase [Mycobacterium sp. MBM]
MVVALTDEQIQLTDSMAGFAHRYGGLELTRSQFDAIAAGRCPDVWPALVAQGLHAVHIPEEFGGQGGALADAACVIDAAGYGLVPGPLLPTVIAGAVLAAADTDQPAVRSLLEAIADGRTAALLLPEDGEIRASPGDWGWRLDGTAGPQLGLSSAQHVVVAAKTIDGETLWFILDTGAPGVTVQAQAPTDLTRDAGILRCDAAAGGAAVTGVSASAARGIAIGLIAAEAAGIARWCVDSVVAYLKVREQFGRPIGTFQALQHKAARLFIDSELTAAAAWDAVRAADQSAVQQHIAAAGAAIAVGRLPELVVDALTMFGAIGYTWEHDLHLYWKRAISLAAATGPAAEWACALGDPDLPGRDFTIELTEVEPEFRAGVAAALDAAALLGNERPGRQNPEYAEFWTGPQRTALADSGLVAPYLPVPWGLAASPAQQLIIDEEFDKRPHLVRPSLGIAEWILPTVLTAGSDAQRARFAVPTMRGEIGWCQLFSEPGAGSDLAALSTRATKVDGGWVIQGQKVWTSSAQRADWGALLARTDPEAKKHKGIGYFLVDMTAPGIRVRPLRTASGDEHFNEVFFDDVFVPDEMLVGEPTAGWSHALATMANERVAIGAYAKLDKESELRALARRAGPQDAAVRRALGEVRAATNAIGALAVRETLGRLAGHGPGPASSVGKVGTALLVRRVTAEALAFSGRAAMVGGAEQPAVAQSLMMPAEVIGGGTVEIQLNIIATMILGLPRTAAP